VARVVASRVLDPAVAVVARDRANVRARVTDARVPVTGVDPDRAPSTLDPRTAGAARLRGDAAARAAAIVRVADRGDRGATNLINFQNCYVKYYI